MILSQGICVLKNVLYTIVSNKNRPAFSHLLQKQIIIYKLTKYRKRIMV